MMSWSLQTVDSPVPGAAVAVIQYLLITSLPSRWTRKSLRNRLDCVATTVLQQKCVGKVDKTTSGLESTAAKIRSGGSCCYTVGSEHGTGYAGCRSLAAWQHLIQASSNTFDQPGQPKGRLRIVFFLCCLLLRRLRSGPRVLQHLAQKFHCPYPSRTLRRRAWSTFWPGHDHALMFVGPAALAC